MIHLFCPQECSVKLNQIRSWIFSHTLRLYQSPACRLSPCESLFSLPVNCWSLLSVPITTSASFLIISLHTSPWFQLSVAGSSCQLYFTSLSGSKSCLSFFVFNVQVYLINQLTFHVSASRLCGCLPWQQKWNFCRHTKVQPPNLGSNIFVISRTECEFITVIQKNVAFTTAVRDGYRYVICLSKLRY